MGAFRTKRFTADIIVSVNTEGAGCSGHDPNKPVGGTREVVPGLIRAVSVTTHFHPPSVSGHAYWWGLCHAG